MTKEVYELTKENMEEYLKEGTWLVDFWADWCGPCRMVAPVLDELYEERNDFKLGKVNIDEQEELATGFGIQSIPTVILFRDGSAELAVVGARGKEVYEELLKVNG
ncbi:MAG: thioredoxin [Oscillospiraceae bacterium]|jgi:thioredoxin 1|nr:thioredoxin [Oscillospiraceae bacterium]